MTDTLKYKIALSDLKHTLLVKTTVENVLTSLVRKKQIRNWDVREG